MAAEVSAVDEELRTLRRVADLGLSPDVMARCPVLCKLLGRGDPYLAVGGLRDRLATAAARGDRDLLALLYSLQGRGDVTERISRAGEKLFVEYRRARDLSNAGIAKLSQKIASDADWQVPFMGVKIDVRGLSAVVQAFVQCASGYVGYRHPKFFVDGNPVVLDHRRNESGEWERHSYGPLTIDLRAPERTLRMRRIGSASVRANVYYTANNPRVQIRSQLAYLTYAIELILAPTPSDPDQPLLFNGMDT